MTLPTHTPATCLLIRWDPVNAPDAPHSCNTCSHFTLPQLAVAAYMQLSTPDRHQLDTFIDLLIPHCEDRHWHGSMLHIQIDDDNIRLDCGDKHPLAYAWNALSLPLRAIATQLWGERFTPLLTPNP